MANDGIDWTGTTSARRANPYGFGDRDRYPFGAPTWEREQLARLPGLALGALDEVVRRSQLEVEQRLRFDHQDALHRAFEEGRQAGAADERAELTGYFAQRFASLRTPILRVVDELVATPRIGKARGERLVGELEWVVGALEDVKARIGGAS